MATRRGACAGEVPQRTAAWVLLDASSVSNVVKDAAIASVISSVAHARCAAEHKSFSFEEYDITEFDNFCVIYCILHGAFHRYLIGDVSFVKLSRKLF